MRVAVLWSGVALAAVLALAAALAVRPLWHDDTFFHLRTGELVASSWRVPTVDSFTHTVAGTPWTSHEWGFGLLFYACYRLGGYAAVMALMPILLVSTLLVVYLQLRRALGPDRLVLAAPLLALGVGAAERSCLVLRAALITSLGVALVGLLMQRLRESGRRRDLVALALVFLIWSNMHAGVVFGLFVVGLHWIQSVVDAWRNPAARNFGSLLRGAPRDRALLVLACAAITLLTPNGIDLWTFSFRVNTLFFHSGITWNMGQYAAPVPARHPFFFALLALCLLACLPLRRCAALLRDPRWPIAVQLLGLAFFAVLALRSNRFILDFVVFALPFCALSWGGTVEAGAAPPPQARPWSARLAPLGLVAVLAVAAILPPALPERLLDARVPVRLAEFMARERIDGRMFNPEDFGGYLGWRLRTPVYWDGRNDINLPTAIEWAHKRNLTEIVQRHALDVLILDQHYWEQFAGELLAQRDLWAIVYWDNRAVLLLRRVPKFTRVIERLEYELLRPFGVPTDAEIARLAREPALRSKVEAEIARALAQSDDTNAAWYLRGRLAQDAGNARGAYAALRHAAAHSDDGQTLYHLARAARDLGKADEARGLLDRAMQRGGP